MNVLINERVHTLLGDMVTPVAMYRRLRDAYAGCFLLESVDFQPGENCSTYICINPIAGFKAVGNTITISHPGSSAVSTALESVRAVPAALEAFTASVRVTRSEETLQKEIANGFFGYISYDSVQCFEDITLKNTLETERYVPEVQYHLFEFVLAVNHYRNEMYLVHNCIEGDSAEAEKERYSTLLHTIFRGSCREYSFQRTGGESSNFTDDEHRAVIDACKKHIFRGDIFQIVPSRRFAQPYAGDDFMVYRALRSINPSPYLFYFDYGSFRIFGSSPEAEIIIRGTKATVCPIAGTYPRFSDPVLEQRKIEELKADPKENAEHVMLVDLARNDLSKHCDQVIVENYREVHRFSHVIHLVSKVTGTMSAEASPIAVLGDTFPAGTLSGAPKYRAMELIDRYERGARGIYGGAIGFIDFNGDTNHAIMIRTFLSKDGVLFRQAGGGVVADSVPDSEVAEVKNKLGALAAALVMAEEMQDEAACAR